jgi:nitroreductase
VASLHADLTQIARELGKSYWEFIAVGSNSLYGAPAAVILSHPGRDGGDTTQFVVTMLLAAQALGLATCWLGYPLADSDLIRQLLEIPENERISAVVALGYPDPDSPASTYRSPRDELDAFVRWVGFD